MSKNIIFCADGTWCGPGDDSDGKVATTNVYHTFVNLAGTLAPRTLPDAPEQERILVDLSGQITQIAKYLHGVGHSGNWLVHLLGGWVGAGLIDRIVRGYTFISRNYLAGDRIFILGFSRGAYTARALAGMIAAKGLLDATQIDLEGDRNAAYSMGLALWFEYCCKSKDKAALEALLRNGIGFAAHMFLAPPETRLIDNVPIQAVAVWDTVGSLGIPGYDGHGAAMDMFQFADKTLSPAVRVGLHAVSIDEKRGNFAPTLWEPHSRITQVLFAGGHGDVGGGNKDRGLSDIAYEWMERRLRALGVAFAANPHYVPQVDAHAPMLLGGLPPLPLTQRELRLHCKVKQEVVDRLTSGKCAPPYAPRNSDIFGSPGKLVDAVQIEP